MRHTQSKLLLVWSTSNLCTKGHGGAQVTTRCIYLQNNNPPNSTLMFIHKQTFLRAISTFLCVGCFFVRPLRVWPLSQIILFAWEALPLVSAHFTRTTLPEKEKEKGGGQRERESASLTDWIWAETLTLGDPTWHGPAGLPLYLLEPGGFRSTVYNWSTDVNVATGKPIFGRMPSNRSMSEGLYPSQCTLCSHIALLTQTMGRLFTELKAFRGRTLNITHYPHSLVIKNAESTTLKIAYLTILMAIIFV